MSDGQSNANKVVKDEGDNERRVPGEKSARGEDQPYVFDENATNPLLGVLPKDEAPENFDHRDYYNRGDIEVIDFIEDQGHLGFCRQIAMKYICRSGMKGGSTKKMDLYKAIRYLKREADRAE